MRRGDGHAKAHGKERCWDWGTGRRDVIGDLEARGSEVMEMDWEGWGSSNRITGVRGTMLG